MLGFRDRAPCPAEVQQGWPNPAEALWASAWCAAGEIWPASASFAQAAARHSPLSLRNEGFASRWPPHLERDQQCVQRGTLEDRKPGLRLLLWITILCKWPGRLSASATQLPLPHYYYQAPLSVPWVLLLPGYCFGEHKEDAWDLKPVISPEA